MIDAFEQLGIVSRLRTGASDPGVDFVLDPEGAAIVVEVKHRSLVTDEVAERLLAEIRPNGTTLLVVADRVTDTARKVLVAHRSGYLDLRGRLAIRTDRLVVEADVQPVKERPDRSDALSGKAGLEIATALLMQPEQTVAVRELARRLGRSPSTVSDIVAALRGDGLIEDGKVVGTDLFWRAAERWPTKRIQLANPPPAGDATLTQPLRLGLGQTHESGWALTDSAAAAAYGAPLPFRSGQVLDFFVPDQLIVRRATTLLGSAVSPSQVRATVRVAPVPAVSEHRVDLSRNPTEWPLAHPLFVALDLAQDAGRGREILDAWTPESRWPRVW